MFEALITKVLNKVLGDFIENLDSKQLDLSLLKGDLNLTNLALRSDLFDSLPVPFALSYGQVGLIHLRIPFWNLFTSPLIIEISDILAIVRPKHVKEWNEEVEIEAYKQAQRRQIEKYELIQEEIMENVIKKDDPDKIDSLVNKIIDNIEIRIKNVYLRYEDSISSQSLGDGTFSIGVLLEELITNTTASDFLQQAASVGQKITYKVVKLTNFMIFMDYDQKTQPKKTSPFLIFGGNAQDQKKENISSKPIDISQLQQDKSGTIFRQLIANEFKNLEYVKHRYLIEPLNLEARLKLNKFPSHSEPQYDITVLLGGHFNQNEDQMSINTNFHQPQIVRVVKLLEYIGYFGEFQSGAISLQRQKKIELEVSNQYVELYTEWKELQNAQNESKGLNESLNNQLKNVHAMIQIQEKLQVIEEDYSAEKIIVLRNFANRLIDQQSVQRKMKQEIEKQVRERKKQLTNWGGLFTTRDEDLSNEFELLQYRRQLETEIENKFHTKKTDYTQELSRLTENMGYEFVSLKTEDLKFDHIDDEVVGSNLQIAILVPNFKVSLSNEYDQKILELVIGGQLIEIAHNNENLKLSFSLLSLLCRDLWTGTQFFERFIETRDIEIEGEVHDLDEEDIDNINQVFVEEVKKALLIQVEIPSSEEKHIRIKVESERTLFIIANFQIVKEIVRTMSNAFTQEDIELSFYQEAATEKAIELINQGKELLENIKKGQYSHTAIELSIFIQAPMIIIPEDIFDQKKPCLLIDAGFISLKSHLIDTEDVKGQNLKEFKLATLLYDRYEATFSEFQICLLENGMPYTIARGCGTQVVKRLNIQLEFFNCLEPMHPVFPTAELVFIIKSFDINLSISILNLILKLQAVVAHHFNDTEEIIFAQTFKDLCNSSQRRSTLTNEDQLKLKMLRETNRKQSKLSQDINPNQIEEIKEFENNYGFENQKMLQAAQTSFKIYFSVERFSLTIQKEITKGRSKQCENLLNIQLLNFGVEIDFDRFQNLKIKVTVFKLIFEDIHRKSKIAEPFRMILSNSTQIANNSNLKFKEPNGVMQRSLLFLSKKEIDFSSIKEVNSENQQNFLALSIDMLSLKNEISVTCLLSDIKIIFAVPTLNKFLSLANEIDHTVARIEIDLQEIRKAKIKLFEQVMTQIYGGALSNSEQTLQRKIFYNLMEEWEIDHLRGQKMMKECINRLKNVWEVNYNVNNSQLFQQSYNQNIRLHSILKQEQYKSKLKLNIHLDRVLVWIPLFSNCETTKVLQISFLQELVFYRISHQENTIDMTLNEIIKNEVLDSHDILSFSLSQFTIEMIESINQFYHRQSQRKFRQPKHRLSSLSEEDSSISSADEEMNNVQQQSSIILTPCRLSLKLENIQNANISKLDIDLDVEPIQFSVSFAHIDFFNIIAQQINEALIEANPCENMQEEQKIQDLKLNKIQKKPYQADHVSKKDTSHILFKFESISISLNDDQLTQVQLQPLICATISNISGDIIINNSEDDAGTFILKKIGVWTMRHAQINQHLEISIQIDIAVGYFNPRTLAFEPLIEKWDFKILINQLANYTQKNIKLESDKLLNINLTYGMALTLRRIMDLMTDSLNKAEEIRKQEDSEEQTEFKNNLMIESPRSEKQSNMILESFEPTFLIQNFLGLDGKFAIHDEFSDENLESNLMEFDQKRKSKIMTGFDSSSPANQMKIFSVSSNHENKLSVNFRQLTDQQRKTTLNSLKGIDDIQPIEEEPLRIDFKCRGLSKISSIPIEGLGIYSYKAKIVSLSHQELLMQKKPFFRSAGNSKEQTLGILFNIKMNGSVKSISIESQLLIANKIDQKVLIYVKTAIQDHSEISDDQMAEIESQGVFKVPLAWLINETKTSLFICTETGPQLILKNVAKYFTAKYETSKLVQNNSQVLKLSTNIFTSVDIHCLKCLPLKDNPPQYLISFNCPLQISNYNFSSLSVSQIPNIMSPESRSILLAKLGPKETAFIQSIDVITGSPNLTWSIYENQDVRYSLLTPDFEAQSRALVPSTEKFKISQGQSISRQKIKLQMEVRKINNLQSTINYQENFQLRERLSDYTSSYQVMLYPKYIIVNKISLPLVCDNQIISPFSNDYFYSKSDKNFFRIPGYGNSYSFSFNTIGLSGIMALDIDHKSDIPKDKFPDYITYIPQRIELGLTIASATKPFNKTLVISVVPRYVIVNQLSINLVIKQKGKQNQIILNSNQCQTYFFETKKDRLVMIREPSKDELIGITLEKPLYSDLANDESQFWSSPFPIDDVEDFQLSFPKQSSLPFLWNFGHSQRFVRIIISTENEATIQVVITDPVYPEYQIVNLTEDDIQIGQVKDTNIISKLKRSNELEDLIVGEKFQTLNPHSETAFVWPCRNIQNKLLGIKLGRSIQEVNLEKALKSTIVYSDDKLIQYRIEVLVSGNSKQLKIQPNIQDVQSAIEKNKTNFLQKLFFRKAGTLLQCDINLKGIGLSFIDESPQELLYLVFYDMRSQYVSWYESKDDHSSTIETNHKVKLSLRHLQLDNMINQVMPVVLAPAKLLKRHDRKNMMIEALKLENNEEEKFGQNAFADNDESEVSSPFIQIIVSLAETQECQSIRLRSLQCAMQEFIFQCDTSIFNSNMKFVLELINTFTDESNYKVIIARDESFENAKSMKREDICLDLDPKTNQNIILEQTKAKIHANKMFVELIHLGAIKADITFKLEKRAVEIDVADPAKAFGFLNVLYTFIAAVASISHTPFVFKEIILIETFATTDSIVDQLLMNYVRQGIMQFYKLLGSSEIIGNPLGLINKLGTGVFELISEPTKGLLQGPDEFVGGVGKGVQSLVSNVVSGSFESVSKITGSLYTVVKNVSGDKNSQIKRSEHIGEGFYYGVKGGMKELVYGFTGIVTKPIQRSREEGARGFFKGVGSGLVGAITAPVTATLIAGTSITQGVAASANSLGKHGKEAQVDTNSLYARFRPPRYINARNILTEFNEDLALVKQILKSKYFGKYGGDSIKYYALLPLAKKNGDISNIDPTSSILIITESMLLYFRLDTAEKKRGRPHRLFKTRLRKIQGCELFKVQQNKGKKKQTQIFYHTVISCYSQIKGQKRFTITSPDYFKFEKIYKILSLLPFCEAVNRVNKQRNSKILGSATALFEKAF